MRCRKIRNLQRSHSGGTVDLVEEVGTKRNLVRKKMLREDAPSDIEWQRFVQECELMERMQGVPGVVRLVSMSKSNRKIIMYTEFYEHGDLLEVIHKFKLTEGDFGCIFHQVITTVSGIHEIGISHRDIKPENIFLRGDVLIGHPFEVGIGDFGLSAIGKFKESRVGTEIYAPPEIFDRTQSYDPSLIDSWCLGVTMYCVVFETLPWSGRTASEVRDRMLAHTPINWELRKDIPELFTFVMQMLMEYDPEKRMRVVDLHKMGLFKQYDMRNLSPGLGQHSHSSPALVEHIDLSASSTSSTGLTLLLDYNGDRSSSGDLPRAPRSPRKKHFDTLPRKISPGETKAVVSAPVPIQAKEEGRFKRVLRKISPRKK